MEDGRLGGDLPTVQYIAAAASSYLHSATIALCLPAPSQVLRLEAGDAGGTVFSKMPKIIRWRILTSGTNRM